MADTVAGKVGNVLVAVFELSETCTPFDLPAFLMRAEARRQALDKESIFLQLVLQKDHDDGAAMTRSTIFGCLGLLDSIGGYAFAESSADA
ncbi:MAG: hypothetical protein R3245_09720, partial [Kiloniellales bacterium]|nr:hypothetical protein [Kiloniellales bacterium]